MSDGSLNTVTLYRQYVFTLYRALKNTINITQQFLSSDAMYAVVWLDEFTVNELLKNFVYLY